MPVSKQLDCTVPAVGAGRRQGGHVEVMQRRRLSLAIGEVVADGGLEAATVGRVCEQAGVSRRTFYELFADREACLEAAFERAIQRLAQRLVPVYSNGDAPGREHKIGGVARTPKARRWRDRVRGALSVLLEHLDSEPDIARLCVVEAPRAGPRLLEHRRRVLETLASAIDEGRDEARTGSQPPPLTTEGVVGGALSVIHTRLLARAGSASDAPRTAEDRSGSGARPLLELTGPLMAMIVHPYLGPTAARKELERPTPLPPQASPRNGADPFKGLPIRFTYRTARVLSTIATNPGASNRHIAESSGIADEGQMSRLLRRLEGCELIENHNQGHTRGEPNAWTLTPRGKAIHATITTQEPAA